LRLARPGWESLPPAGRWHWVHTHEEAAGLAATLGERVFLSTGRNTLDAFTGVLPTVVARVVEPSVDDATLPEGWLLILDRGPYTLDSERDLLREHRIDVLVTKDSGGEQPGRKRDGADELGIEVVVVRRPPSPGGTDVVTTVSDALDWLGRR